MEVEKRGDDALDLGSCGPWLILEDYQLDFISMSHNKNLYSFTFDAMASFRTRQCECYFSSSFELESQGVDFFAQHLYMDEFYWIIRYIY